MKVRIYKPARTAMQSGPRNTREWVMEPLSADPKFIEPMLGWVGSKDTSQQLRLRFATEAEALEFAARQGYEIVRVTPKTKVIRPKSYAANFDYARVRTRPRPELTAGGDSGKKPGGKRA